jgi:hypothetical protein
VVLGDACGAPHSPFKILIETDMNPYLVAILVVALIVLIIYRQMRTMPVESRRLIIVPVALVVIGMYNLLKAPPHTTGAGVAFTASVVTALVFGVGRGITTHVWFENGVMLRRGTVATLALWVGAIVVRILIAVVARHSGVPLKVTTAELPVFLGITLAVQNGVVWLRAQADRPSAEAGIGRTPDASPR